MNCTVKGVPLIQSLLAMVCALSCLPVLSQEPDAESGFAEIQPLAHRSLLLDALALPGGRWVAVGERGHVVYSDDAGAHWQQAASVPTRSTLTTITQADGRLWAAGHDTVVITSGDDGENWELLNFDPDRAQPIMDIQFADEDNGMAVGAYGLFMVTMDGGQSWDELHVSDDGWHLNDLLDLGNGQLLIAAEAGVSYRSEDGGESWEEISMPYPGSMFGITRGRGDCVLVYGLRGNAQQSCDGGVTWTELDTTVQASLAGGVTAGETTVLAGNSGTLAVRRGDTPFQQVQHSSGVDFSAVLSLGQGNFLLVGEEGSHRYPEPGVTP